MVASARDYRQTSTGCVITPSSEATVDRWLMVMCNQTKQEEDSQEQKVDYGLCFSKSRTVNQINEIMGDVLKVPLNIHPIIHVICQHDSFLNT